MLDMKKILLALILFSPLAAQETQPQPPQPPAQEQEVVSPMPEPPVLPEAAYKKQFIATLIAILVILFAIFLAIWLLKRFSPARVFQNNQRKNIKVLERRHLSPNTFLYHIQIGEKQFVIAESKFHVQTIATMDWNELEKP